MTTRIAKLALGLALLTAACGDRAKRQRRPIPLWRATSRSPERRRPQRRPSRTRWCHPRRPKPRLRRRRRRPRRCAPRRRESPRRRRRSLKRRLLSRSRRSSCRNRSLPAPAPAPAPITGEIGAGSAAALTAGSKVCTSSNQPGDKLVATLNSPLTGTNGKEIPAGSTVVLEVASAAAGPSSDSVTIAISCSLHRRERQDIHRRRQCRPDVVARQDQGRERNVRHEEGRAAARSPVRSSVRSSGTTPKGR